MFACTTSALDFLDFEVPLSLPSLTEPFFDAAGTIFSSSPSLTAAVLFEVFLDALDSGSGADSASSSVSSSFLTTAAFFEVLRGFLGSGAALSETWTSSVLALRYFETGTALAASSPEASVFYLACQRGERE